MADTRVLIVDDNAEVRRELRMLLGISERVQVAGEAAGGAEAVRLAAQLQPDVVLMDLEMPGLDGYAAARQVRAACPSCRIMALSIHEDGAAREKARQAGMVTFVSKAAGVQELLNAIRAQGSPSGATQVSEGERS